MATLHLSTLLPGPPNPTPTSLRPHRPQPPLPLLATCRRAGANSGIRSSSPTTSPKPIDPVSVPDLGTSSVSGEAAAEEDDVKEEFDWYAQWYPVAPVCDLDKRAPTAKTVLGLDVVVWWDRAEGKWQVFEDRCPHRLAPLSEGRIDRWGRLQCVYHGWCFDGSGSCKYIPQAPPDAPPFHTFEKACAAVYPSIEQNKIVWFWPNSDPQFKDIAIKKKPPYLPELDNPSYTSLFGMRDISYGYEVLIENLMDPAHVPYAHHGIMRVPKRSKVPTSDREGGRPLDIRVRKLDISGFIANQEWGYSEFVAPCLFYATSDLSSSSRSDLYKVFTEEELSQRKTQRFLLVFICIPVSPGRSRLIWVFPRNTAVWIDRVVPRWMFHLGQNLILDSDLYLLHLEERKITEAGASNWLKACFVPTRSDALVVAFRKWLNKYSNNQLNWGTKFKPELPSTPPREQLLDRYWSHSVQCSSCHRALKGLRVLEVALQIMSVALIGAVAAMKQTLLSTVSRSAIVCLAVFSLLASRWLSHFIHKNFYFHDYSHAFR